MTDELSASCIIKGTESCGVCFRRNGRFPESTASQVVVIPTVDTVTPGIAVSPGKMVKMTRPVDRFPLNTGNGEPPDYGVPVAKFPVANRLRAQIDDCKKQIGKLNTKRDMLLRKIETLEDAVRELERMDKK